MSRTCTPFLMGDLSPFARSLRDQLARTVDGRKYRRVERPHSGEGLVLSHLAARSQTVRTPRRTR